MTWVNLNIASDLKFAICLDKGEYGWSEFISYYQCNSDSDVDNFYCRLGMQLAILYILEGTDFHYENIIACGEHPVLIDLESLFRPHSPILGTEANEGIDSSVLKIGILPNQIRVGSEFPEVSGVSDADGQAGVMNRMHFFIDDEGDFQLVRSKGKLVGGQNVPRLDDRKIQPGKANIESLKDGFRQVYRLFLSDRNAVKERVNCFKADMVRVIFRHTVAYTHLLDEAYHPMVMTSYDKFDEHFKYLDLAISDYKTIELFVEHERRDLKNGDIPIFRCKNDDLDLITTSSHITKFFVKSGLCSVLDKIDRLSTSDLNRQLWLIDSSFEGVVHDAYASVPFSPVYPDQTNLPGKLITNAEHIASAISKHFFVDGNSASWLVYTSKDLRGDTYTAAQAFYDLYQGMPGEILFFDRLWEATGKSEYLDFSRKALDHLVQRLYESRQSIRPLGLYTGWGSVIWLMAKLSASKNRPDATWLDSLLAGSIFNDLILADRNFSLLKGSAGFIVACVEYHVMTGSADALAMARSAADFLLANRLEIDGGYCWKIISDTPLAGLAHGASGFALAFARLFAVTNELVYAKASLRCVRYERALFIPESRNWRDCRKYIVEMYGDRPFCSTAWSHGAPGIGLARLALLRSGIEDELVHEDLQIAIETTTSCDSLQFDSLVYGNVGNTELLLSSTLGGYFQASIDGLRAGLLDRISNGLNLNTFGTNSPGLMNGLTGIGYQCLRLADSENVPSVLCG